jgi:tetratricopeptide (TPR) repeat protein
MKNFVEIIFNNIRNLDVFVNNYKKFAKNVVIPSKAYINWGINLAISGNIEEAIQKFEFSANMAFKDPESYLNWGIALAKSGQYDEAIDKFNLALKIDPNYSKAYSLLGAALVELDKIEEAENMYQHAIYLAPRDPEIYTNWGIALARQNKKFQAEKKFKQALELNPNTVNPRFLLGAVQIELENFTEAVNNFELALKLQPNNPMIHYHLSICFSQLNDNEKALEEAKTCLDLNPLNLDAYTNLAECYASLKEFEKAEECYKSAEQINDKFVNLYASWGIFLQKNEKYDESIEKLEKAIELFSNDKILYYLAGSYHLKGDLEKAEEILVGVLEKDPNNLDIVCKLGIINYDRNKFEESISYFEKCLTNPRKYSKYYHNLGYAYSQIGDSEKAVKNYKKSIDYHPGSTLSYLNLATIYLDEQKIKEALRNIRAAYKINNDSAIINLFYGIILFEDDDRENAFQKIDRAVELDCENVLNFYNEALINNPENLNYQIQQTYVKGKID